MKTSEGDLHKVRKSGVCFVAVWRATNRVKNFSRRSDLRWAGAASGSVVKAKKSFTVSCWNCNSVRYIQRMLEEKQ